MWRLSVVPSAESALEPVDVVVDSAPHGSVADLAASLGEHLVGAGSRVLLAPVSDGRPWPAQQRLLDSPLRDGGLLHVASVPSDWLTRPARQRRPRAVLRVLSGPEAGREVELHGDVVTLGRGSDAQVRLADPLVSRTHARLLLGATPSVVDLGSAHGTRVGEREVTGAQPFAWGEPIVLGATEVVLRPSDGTTTPEREQGVLRPPRFGTDVVEAELDLPAPPASPRKTPFPWPMMLMPVLIGGGMLAMSRSPMSLIFMVGFPLMMAMTNIVQRRQARKEFEAERDLWRGDVRDVLATLDTSAATQRANAFDDEPDLDAVVVRARTRHHSLWTRQQDEPDFLTVRTGLGERPALVTAKRPSGGDRALRAEVGRALTVRTTLPDLPVPLDLSAGLNAVTGPADDVDAWVRAAIVRLAVTHSPTDLAVTAVLGAGRSSLETWLRWLPHVSSAGPAPVAIGAAQGQALLEGLTVTGGGTGHTLCLVDEGAGLTRRHVEAVAQQAAERQLHLLWLGERTEEVPAATARLVDLLTGELAHARRGGVEEITTPDTLDLATAWSTARSLAGYRDEAAVGAAEALLPPMVRLPDLTGCGSDDVEQVLERWATSRGLRAQLGAGTDGAVTIDLREDGPHGLVAGTTGAGKSELLQSLISSLAVNNPPTRITFLLVDYKGGAAFRECAQLPHTVGYITDLTPALVQRALVSLHAELTTREHLLERYGAKDLPDLERSHPEAAPPSMLICVDEFAALLAEVPDFVDGMVSIAQRGRSLGMHMLLATQRPAGVVTPQIKANTDLRIALRVASPDDSTDVIDAPDAAQLSRRNPGRAWLRRTGHGTRELVQVAWVGARELRREAAAPVQIRPFDARGGSDVAAIDADDGRLHPRTDLERLVDTVTTAHLRSGALAPRRPWLPQLPEVLPLGVAGPGRLVVGADAAQAALVDGAGALESLSVEPAAGQAVLGMIDRPSAQTQEPWVVDFARAGHLLVLGSSGAGKTELLRTLAVGVTAGGDPAAPLVYGLDCGGGGLAVLTGLPSVGSVVVEAQRERMQRLIRMLHRTVADRNAAMASRGVADLAALAATGVDVPRVHVLIDNLPALLESFEGGGSMRRQHADMLVTILQEGRRAGVHVTATAPQRTGVPAPVAAAFGQRLVMRMTIPDDYMMLGVPGGVLDADSPAGRALLGKHEVQVATIGGAGTPVQGERIAAVAAQVAERYPDGATSVPGMPDRLPQTALPVPVRDEVTVGVEEDMVAPVTLALLEAPVLVTGRSRSGRTTHLLGLAQLARRAQRPVSEVVLMGPRAAATAQAWPGEALVVLGSPEEVTDWLAGPGAVGPTALGSGDDAAWRLVLVDDVHEWERAWEASGPERRAVEALAAWAGGAAARRTGLVVATDADDARTRQHIPGLVSTVRRSRRGVLLSPEMGDGTLLGAQVPMSSHETLAGPGRGLLVAAGTFLVIQATAATIVVEQSAAEPGGSPR